MREGYPSDLRWAGRSSEVKVIKPDGSIVWEKATLFEDEPLRSKNYHRLNEDLKLRKKERRDENKR